MWVITALGFLCAFVLAFVGIESAARWHLRRQGLYYVWTPGLKVTFYLDRKIFPELPEMVRIEINRDGERGDEPPDSENGVYRILVAGGSAAECAGLDQPLSWPCVLQRILDAPESLRTLGATKVHVGNIARSGVGSKELDIILEKVLPRYRKLDTIVINVGGNDVFHWLQKGAPSPYPSSDISMAHLFDYHPDGPFGWTPKRLALSELVRRQIWRWRPPRKVRKGAGKWMGAARAMRANAKEIRTSVSDPEHMADHFERYFRRVLERALAHSSHVLVIRQPWFEKEYTAEEAAHIWHGGMGDPWRGEHVTVFYSTEVLCNLMRLIDQRAAKVAAALNIDAIDLMPRIEQGLKTFYDFVHFTPEGAAVVAETAAEKILEWNAAKRHERDAPGRKQNA